MRNAALRRASAPDGIQQKHRGYRVPLPPLTLPQPRPDIAPSLWQRANLDSGGGSRAAAACLLRFVCLFEQPSSILYILTSLGISESSTILFEYGTRATSFKGSWFLIVVRLICFYCLTCLLFHCL